VPAVNSGTSVAEFAHIEDWAQKKTGHFLVDLVFYRILFYDYCVLPIRVHGCTCQLLIKKYDDDDDNNDIDIRQCHAA